MRFHGRKQGDNLVFPKWQFEIRKHYLAKLKDGQKIIEIITKEYRPKTLEQLGYYFAVILPTVHKQLVEDGHEIHGVPISEDMADKILKEYCARFDSKVVNKRDMDVQQAAQFISNCIAWANDMLGCYIPEPKEL